MIDVAEGWAGVAAPVLAEDVPELDVPELDVPELDELAAAEVVVLVEVWWLAANPAASPTAATALVTPATTLAPRAGCTRGFW